MSAKDVVRSGSGEIDNSATKSDVENKHEEKQDEEKQDARKTSSSREDSEAVPSDVSTTTESTDEPNNTKRFRCNMNYLICGYYIKYTWREIKSRKFNFCIGTCSCLITVLVASVCYTLLGNAPVVFLQQAEADSGQYDLRMMPSDAVVPFLNYTLASQVLSVKDDFSKTSPRQHLDGRIYSKECSNSIERLGLDFYDPTWVYLGESGNATDCNMHPENHCLNDFCPEEGLHADSFAYSTIRLIDTEKEDSMGFGRSWPYKKLQQNEAVLSEEDASIQGLKEGDMFFIYVAFEAFWNPIMSNILRTGLAHKGGLNTTETDETIRNALSFAGVIVPMKLVGTYPKDGFGKLGHDVSGSVFLEYSEFIPMMSSHLHPNLDSELRDMVQQADLYHYSQAIYLNFPPPRTANYLETNYDVIQGTVVTFASASLFYIGFPQVSVHMPILNFLRSIRFFTLYLGLIINIIITILFVLSAMLIYSLLMISIETRTFEMGVLRMVGMKRVALIQLLLTQAFAYSIPAWGVGLLLSQLFAAALLGQLERMVGVPVERRLTSQAIIVATIIGVIIPIISSLLPIKSALSTDLHESLDLQHSKTVAVKFSIERSEGESISMNSVVTGTSLFVFGFLIYYLLPLSLLTFNLTLFFNIFFGLIIGMLVGLILLSLNFEHLLERFLVFFFLFWEKRALSHLVLKNLVAHRIRNRKTTVMYSVALGFILFITVAYRMEISTARFRVKQSSGVEMFAMDSESFGKSTAEALEIMGSSDAAIESYSWLTQKVGSHSEADYAGTYMRNLGHVYGEGTNIFAVSPNYFETGSEEFLMIAKEDETTGASVTEQLYTVEGSQSAIVGSYYMDLLNLNSLKDTFLFELFPELGTDQAETKKGIFRLQTEAFLDSAPTFSFSKFPRGDQSSLVSFHTYMRFTQGAYESMEDIPLRAFMIKFVPNADNDDKDRIAKKLRSIAPDVWDFREFEGDLKKTSDVMDIVFNVATFVAILLCAFSLVASMYTNIFEQSKEIGILRAIGLTVFQIGKIYVYEAFVLVLGASLMGMCIGILIGWTMMAQRALFTQFPIGLELDYAIILVVVIGAIVVSLISSCLPIRLLSKKPVAQVMRTVI